MKRDRMRALALISMFAAFLASSCGSDSDDSGGSATPALNGVSISSSTSKVAPAGTLSLEAKADTTGSPEGIAYRWEVTDGATLSPTEGETTTLTAGSDEKDVTVTLTAVYGTTEKSATKTVKITTSTADLIVKPGAKVTTYGWADRANSGEGMSYPDTDNIIVIDDDGYKVGSGSLTSYGTYTKRQVFTNAIASGSVSSSSVNDTAAIVVLSGRVDLSDGKISDDDHSYFDEFNSDGTRAHGDIVYLIGNNKAIIGVNGARIAYGGLQGKNNPHDIIIQNVEFYDAHGSVEGTGAKASIDALGFEGSFKKNDSVEIVKKGKTYSTYEADEANIPHNIWIDHCKFSDGICSDLENNVNHDGALDFKSAQYVTVSYCEFTNHDKVTLLAPDEAYVKETDRQITFHHNYYHSATQRMPRSRGCQVHVYNSYFNDIYQCSLGPGIGSQFIVENNYFGTHKNSKSILKYYDATTSSNTATLSHIYASGNIPNLSSSNTSSDSNLETATAIDSSTDTFNTHIVSTKPWTIDYSYTLEEASTLATLIPSAAGVDKADYTAIVEVDGTTY